MVNKVTLIGNLGRDPEIKSLDSGAKVARLAVATNESYKDKNGEWQDRTEWHTVILWRYQAESAERFRKGDMIYIDGKLTHRSYETEDKQTRYITEVVGNYVRKLKGSGDGYNTSPMPNQEPNGTSKAAEPATDSSMEDEDLPF